MNAETYIEIAAVGFSIVAVYLTTKRIIWCWPLSILAVLLSARVYFSAGLYAEMALQSYYLFAAITGWIGWHRTSNTDGYIGVLRMKIAHWWYAVGVGSSTGALLGFILWQQTKSPIAFADSLIATSSLVATWFMVKRYLENWLMWVVIDSACIIVYLHKGLYSFAGLFVLYTLLALKGYFDWKKPTPYNA